MTDEHKCPHCRVAEPSTWDSVLSHWAHPADEPGKLKFCHEPWRERAAGAAIVENDAHDAHLESCRWTLRSQKVLTIAEVEARWPEATTWLDYQLPHLTTRDIRFVTTANGKRLRIAIKDWPVRYHRAVYGTGRSAIVDERHKSPSWDDRAKVWVRFSEHPASSGFCQDGRPPRLLEPEARSRVAMVNRWLEHTGSQWRARMVEPDDERHAHMHGDIVFCWPDMLGPFAARFEGAPATYQLLADNASPSGFRGDTLPGTPPPIPAQLRQINDADYLWCGDCAIERAAQGYPEGVHLCSHNVRLGRGAPMTLSITLPALVHSIRIEGTVEA